MPAALGFSQSDVVRSSLGLAPLLGILLFGATRPALAQSPTHDLMFRRLDGYDPLHLLPEGGLAGRALLRLVPAHYADGIAAPSGADRPSPRAISQAVCAQAGDVPSSEDITDFVWQWGQFLDHDLDLSHEADPVESFPILVPRGDPLFDPFGTGIVTIDLSRSAWELDGLGVRQQTNAITAWIDASNVYGSSDAHAALLRGANGRLAVGAGNLLPDDPATGGQMFLAGDERANENVGLTALHTLFVREHNLWVDALVGIGITGDDAYHVARMMVGAEMQAITYGEFLPIVLGRDALPRYRGLRPEIDPGIANAFSTAAYRFGHTMLSPTIRRLDANGQTIAAGDLALRDAFFSPDEIRNHGIDSLLRGLASQRPQAVDVHVIDDVRNFLFGPPGAGGFDLASLNIQRGRDHGLPSYAQAREALGLRRIRDFEDIPAARDVRENLRQAYGRVEHIDLWVGGLAELPARGALVGPTFQRILSDQFRRLRDSDRFWYQRHLPPAWADFIARRTLGDIIRDNTGIGSELQDDVFRLQSRDRTARRSRGRGRR